MFFAEVVDVSYPVLALLPLCHSSHLSSPRFCSKTTELLRLLCARTKVRAPDGHGRLRCQTTPPRRAPRASGRGVDGQGGTGGSDGRREEEDGTVGVGRHSSPRLNLSPLRHPTDRNRARPRLLNGFNGSIHAKRRFAMRTRDRSYRRLH